jgi:hypothetical protein
MNPNCWRLNGHVARLNLPGLSLAFDADRPADGLTTFAVFGQPWPGGRLMGVTGSIQSSANATLMDWHVRGDDLIAVYETGQPDAAQLDLLWRAARPTAEEAWLGRIDLLVSVRTERLDWRHDVCLESVLPEAAMIEKFDSSVSVHAARGWSVAMMVHPADLGDRELTATPATSHVRHPLFRTGTLEKGVILRARARVWFLPSAVDRATVATCLAEFAAADPPLGT